MYLCFLSGMEEAHCERTEFLSNYPLNLDDIMLIPGSIGRIRPRDSKSPTCKQNKSDCFKLYARQVLNSKQVSCSSFCLFVDDPKVIVANLTVSTRTQLLYKSDVNQTKLHIFNVRTHLFLSCVSVQNANSALQTIPEAAFTQKASLRQKPQDRGCPAADGEEVAHC